MSFLDEKVLCTKPSCTVSLLGMIQKRLWVTKLIKIHPLGTIPDFTTISLLVAEILFCGSVLDGLMDQQYNSFTTTLPAAQKQAKCYNVSIKC